MYPPGVGYDQYDGVFCQVVSRKISILVISLIHSLVEVWGVDEELDLGQGEGGGGHHNPSLVSPIPSIYLNWPGVNRVIPKHRLRLVLMYVWPCCCDQVMTFAWT